MARASAYRVAAMLLMSGCGDEPATDVDGFSQAELAKLKMLSPLPSPRADPTNRVADDPQAAALGQRLFFDKRFSGAIKIADDGTNGGLGAVGDTGKVACASCHVPDSWFQDSRSRPNALSIAIGRTSRNTPPAVNAAYYDWQQGGGAADSVWLGPLGPAEFFLGSTRLKIAHVIYDRHKAPYEAVFGPLASALEATATDAARFPASGKPKSAATDPDGPWEAMTADDQQAVNTIFSDFGKAIEAYERLLTSGDAPFDRYVAGDLAAIDASAKRGLKLFIGKAACVACHAGPSFTDQKFHDLGVPQTGDNVPAADAGRFDAVPRVLANIFNTSGPFSDDTTTGKLTGLAQADGQKGQFRTKQLRQIAETGPYMHTGQLATLADVVAFYDKGGETTGFAGAKDPLMVPLNLSAAEQADLVAFLQTLTGAPVPAALRADTSGQ